MGANGQAQSQVASATHIGGKTFQQDEYLVQSGFLTLNEQPIHLYAVFDGHGSDGQKAAKAAKVEFPKALEAVKDTLITSPLDALKAAFLAVNETLSADQAWDSYLSGTTAVVALHVGNQLHVAHVGDSRLVIIHDTGSAWSAKQMTEDHTCENSAERKRVVEAGGRVEQLMIDGKLEGPLRIFKGSLPYPGASFRIVVSRSLGDAAAQRIGVIPEPEVLTIPLTSTAKYIVLGTDGLWDGLSLDEVASLGSKAKGATDYAEQLLARALKGLDSKQLDDNITHVICQLQ